MIFDTHTHYDDKQFDEDREELLSELTEYGIDKIVDVGASLASTKEAFSLSKKYPFVYWAAGVHPSETAELNAENFEELCRLVAAEKAAGTKKLVAVGEIGLDYYWDEPECEIQKYWFEKQLELAIKENLPVIIHSREAAADTLEIIRKYYKLAAEQGKKLTGVVHCFSYTPEIAREYLEMDFYIGVGGVVTFKNAKKLKEVVAEMPLEKLVLETDCPYLSPEPLRGTRNSSKNLRHVVKYIAELREITENELEDITYNNALKLYGITE